MKNLQSLAELGFIYTVRVLRRDGRIEVDPPRHNLIPVEGLNHLMGVGFKSVTQVPTWYLGIFEGNYTPTPDVLASTIVGLSTECTTYANATRHEFVEGSVSAGSVDNSANPALFVMNADKTIYGGFMSSASSKGAGTGVLMSAVRFASPKVLESGDKLEVIAQNYLVSA